MQKCSLAALAVAALLLRPPTAQATPLFGPNTDYPTGNTPYSVAIGDLDGDGKPDLAVASGVGVSVLIGSGGGSFGPRSDHAAGSSPSCVAIGDLNGDGKPDLVVVNSGSNTVSILLGNGDGTFAAKTDFGTGSAPLSAVIGDLDGDGKPDLAVSNYGSNTVSVLHGNGDGSFGPKTDYASGNLPSSVAAGDLNGDGIPDLVTANYTSNSVSVLLGTGGGMFGPKTDFATGSFPVCVAIGDLDADGKPDLATANYVGNTASVLRGNGDGTFGARTDYVTGSRPHVVEIADLNGDGAPDLASANYTSNSVSVLLGNGNGTFAAKTDFVSGVGPYSVAIGDLDGDGKPDLALANSGAATVSVLLRQAVPSVTSLSGGPNPSIIGRTVTLTASVVPDSARGMVRFMNGALSLGTATLSSGVATLTTAALGVGEHSLSAAYGGDGALSASVSPVLAHAVLPDSSTIVLASSPSPSGAGQAVLLTATVTPAGASGSVEFREGSGTIGTGVLAGGVATLSVPGLCGGSYAFTAVYTGDPVLYGSVSPALAHEVNPAPTVAALVAGLNPSRLGQAVSFTASVTDPAATPCALTGAVEFVIDSVVFGAPVPLSGGSATISGITSLASGPHAVRAIYTGSASFLTSTSPAITQEVDVPAPGLVGVHDIVNDQGGRVKLLWDASYLDLAPYHDIESYWILRSVPPAAAAHAGARVPDAATGAIDPRVGGFVAVTQQGAAYVWEFIASQPAFHVPNYSYVAATTRDSVTGSNPLTAFMVMARTAGGAQWWYSNPDSGYSVDNLAPRAPAPFAGTYGSGAATLHWGRNPEADLAEYRLHRGATADFVPGPDNLVVATTDTGYVDGVNLPMYYRLCAVDVHGNVSGFTLMQPAYAAGVGAGAALAFALEGVRPNPSQGGPLRTAFTLPTSGPARLELVDVSGRRVLAREVGVLGAGRHSVVLDAAPRVAPGLYLLRLTQGANVRVARVAVLR